MMAWAVPVVAGRYRIIPLTAAALVIAASTAAARIQVGYWRNSITLWEHALAAPTESYIAHINLGLALAEQGKDGEAVPHYLAALRLRPGFAEAHNNLGVALANQGKTDEAIHEFLEGLRAKPAQAESHYSVAVLLARKGETRLAVEHLQAALRLNPLYVEARQGFGEAAGSGLRQVSHFSASCWPHPPCEVRMSSEAERVNAGETPGFGIY
jgi:tetratricopeptide (TPR) repeat protein